MAAASANQVEIHPTPTTGTPGRGGRHLVRWAFSLLVVVPVVAVLGGWAIDQARTSGRVIRHTTLAGRPISGLDRAGLASLADDLDRQLSEVPVTVDVDESMVDTNAAALGGRVDRDALTSAALNAHRDGSVLLRPVRWITSFGSTVELTPTYTVAADAAGQAADTIVTPALDQPLEPDLALSNGKVTVTPGQPGVAVTGDQITATLPPVLSGRAPFTLALKANPTTPRHPDADIQRVADEANAATDKPVTFKVLDQAADVDAATMRGWVHLDTSGPQPGWTMDPKEALNDLVPRFPSLGSPDKRAHFDLVDGKPVIIPASESVVCCTEASVADLAGAVKAANAAVAADPKAKRSVSLEAETTAADDGTAALKELGIVEQVSTFTTKHACCENRVTNIHRIADIVRGVVIKPGENFSVNRYVGERTLAKGFVADHAIVDGVLEDQVGGGVSQFATTFFNASFFGGLDFNEYQSHSLYISRYPKGREATVSWPRPDLSVKNTTGYGILVWTSYTSTSLTVSFYSTKHIAVDASDPVATPQGKCTRWTTARTRTYDDGRKVHDSVFALYRPGEGFDCQGNPTKASADSGMTPATAAGPTTSTTRPAATTTSTTQPR